MLITIYEHLERIIRVSTVFIWRRARGCSSSGSSCTACHAAVLDARIVHDSTPDIIDAPPARSHHRRHSHSPIHCQPTHIQHAASQAARRIT